jgi:hypothetical protein
LAEEAISLVKGTVSVFVGSIPEIPGTRKKSRSPGQGENKNTFYASDTTLLVNRLILFAVVHVTTFDVELHLLFRFIGELGERVARDVR